MAFFLKKTNESNSVRKLLHSATSNDDRNFSTALTTVFSLLGMPNSNNTKKKQLPVNKMAYSYCIIILFLILPSFCLEGNVTIVIDIRNKSHKVAKYVAVLFFTVLLLYGIISNTLMVAVLFCKDQIDETTWINRVFATFNTFSLFSILHFSLLLTLSRFVAIILPKYYTLFESTKLYFLIAFVWLSVLAITSVDFYYCIRRFLVWNLSWQANCAKSSGMSKAWWRIYYRWALLIPNVMFVMYIAIFCSIRRKRHFTTNSSQNQGITNIGVRRHESNAMKIPHYEWSMLIQAAWNCGVLEIGVFIFNFMSPLMIKIFGKEADLPSRIFINCYVIFICSVLPTVHFTYSNQSRDIIKHHLYRWLQLRVGRLEINPLSKVCWDARNNVVTVA
ncbi:unnamed protein product [Wuchereria bancrofti]|uniref:G-protein coupled receptors family 1 profile domain-containing protein n=2 Tax=Wuchereria bancrofti TaxID=6293 RepID=A0A3P7DIE3_WUCBA|nr:unnamed protein product [Wuchereria bancrofti]